MNIFDWGNTQRGHNFLNEQKVSILKNKTFPLHILNVWCSTTIFIIIFCRKRMLNFLSFTINSLLSLWTKNLTSLSTIINSYKLGKSHFISVNSKGHAFTLSDILQVDQSLYQVNIELQNLQMALGHVSLQYKARKVRDAWTHSCKLLTLNWFYSGLMVTLNPC